MPTQIEILASLQSVDREIKERSDRKLTLLNELQAKEREINAKKGEIAILAGSLAEKEKQRVEKDSVFQDEGRKAMDKRMRMNRIKNVKELQAVQREIDQIKQNNSVLEEELIRIMEEIDQIRAKIQSKESELSALHEEWQAKQQALSGEITSLDADVSAAMARRQGIAAQVAGDLMTRYELIFARRGGTAVVEVAAGICQGCYMNIPPQLWNEIIKREKVHLCPSCQRMLYFRPEALAEAKSA